MSEHFVSPVVVPVQALRKRPLAIDRLPGVLPTGNATTSHQAQEISHDMLTALATTPATLQLRMTLPPHQSPPQTPHLPQNLPYKIAVLCYLYDDRDHVLLLHRRKPPNQGMYSPIGGKLEVTVGEGPHECAVREIWEEAGLSLTVAQVRLTGIVSERAYEGQTHWLIFLFEVLRSVSRDEVKAMDFDEGRLEWIDINRVLDLPIPETDARFMWPLVREHRHGGFFTVHIDCSVQPMTWTVTESVKPHEKSM